MTLVTEKNTKELSWVVVSVKMKNTLVVSVEVVSMNKILKKRFVRHKRFYAHVNSSDINVWDIVVIRAHRPMSKLKRRIYVETLKKSKLS